MGISSESVGSGAIRSAIGSGSAGGEGGSDEDFEDDYLDMNDDSDFDYPHDGPTRPTLTSYHSQQAQSQLTPTLPASSSTTAIPSSNHPLPPTNQYSLIAFSTGMILEDGYTRVVPSTAE